ncbi:MAG: sigma-54 factor interaction domain-containing protein, partial [Betaproteobacteria bacterium]|nr:sigma-54 factor interaction domain-containing protein [Betaproteobacteria bacterium]
MHSALSSKSPVGASRDRLPRLVGASPAMKRLEEAIARVGHVDCPVLVTGETGSGKDEVARAIHAAGSRAAQPFVAINCAGIVGTLAESLLFGHEKGSFTGADDATTGAFRAADRGILFLDEIGELPLELQPKLLRVLELREVAPVGATRPVKVDVQVIAAT